MNQNTTITLASFVKNEAHCLEHMLTSIKDYVDEIVIVDTGSTDNTVEVANKYTKRVYQIGFTDFGKIRTLTAHLAKMQWVLMLDADEILEGGQLLKSLVQKPTNVLEWKEKEALAFPRKRWLDLAMTQQTEIEAYPDWQVRFFRNEIHHIYRRALHEEFHGGIVELMDKGITIHHFQDVFKDEARKQERDRLYQTLAPLAKVTIHGGKPTC